MPPGYAYAYGSVREMKKFKKRWCNTSDRSLSRVKDMAIVCWCNVTFLCRKKQVYFCVRAKLYLNSVWKLFSQDMDRIALKRPLMEPEKKRR